MPKQKRKKDEKRGDIHELKLKSEETNIRANENHIEVGGRETGKKVDGKKKIENSRSNVARELSNW